MSWEEEKKLQAERRKKEKEVNRLEEEISKVEQKLSDLQNQLANPDVYSNGEKAKAVQNQISELEIQLEKLNVDWENAASLL